MHMHTHLYAQTQRDTFISVGVYSVPLLDLSSINQPDDWMDPVEVKTVTPLSAQLSQIRYNIIHTLINV